MTDLPTRAVALRAQGLSARQIAEQIGVPRRTVARWVQQLPAPGWTKRPTAKDGLRARAVELRAAGWSVPDIAQELGVARSTAWLWVRDRPLDPAGERAVAGAQRRREAVRAFWAPRNEATDARRREVQAAAAGRVGQLSEAELLRVGALIYWCEGAKAKPWRRDESVAFINSDPGLIAVFLRFLAVAGVPAGAVCYRVSIHESADVEAAVSWWADFVGVERDAFLRSTLKRHDPVTVRRNTGADYRGCLIVRVRKGRELYWLIEGIVRSVVDECAGRRGGAR